MDKPKISKTYHIQIYKCSVDFIDAFREIIRNRNYVHDSEFFREVMREVVKNG